MCYYIPPICFSCVIILCAHFRLILFDYVIVLFTSYIRLIWLYSSVNLLFGRYIMLLPSSSYATSICGVLSSTSVCYRWVDSSYYLVLLLVLHSVLLLLCTICLSIIRYYYHCPVPSLYCIVFLFLLLCTVSLLRACQLIVIVKWQARQAIDTNSDSSSVSGWHATWICLYVFCDAVAWPVRRMKLLPGRNCNQATLRQEPGKNGSTLPLMDFCQSSCPVGDRRCPCGTEVRQWQALEARRSCSGCSVNQRPCEST